MNNTGYIRVSVTNSGGQFPVEGAVVTVTDYVGGRERVLYSLRTDQSGQTRAVPVPAVPADESRHPGVSDPYTTYSVGVRANGYYPAESNNVPVFADIVSLQAFDLEPLSEELPTDATGYTTNSTDPGAQTADYPKPGNTQEGTTDE